MTTSILWAETNQRKVKLSGMDDWHRGILKKYCQDCHNEKKKKGKFRIDNLPLMIEDSPGADRWQKVLNAMNAGEMPPDDEMQLDPKDKANFLDDLAQAMVDLRNKMSDRHGEIAMSRLNRREYKNTLRDLLGVEINVSQLPSDHGLGNYDTNGASLFISSNQVESYLELGQEALEEAIDQYLARDFYVKHRHEAEELTDKYRAFYEKKEFTSKWVKALKTAVEENPENKSLLEEIKQKHKTRTASYYYRYYDNIKGAPELTDKYNFRNNAKRIIDFNNASHAYPYLKRYRDLPNIDDGAFIAVPTIHPSQLPTGYIVYNLPVKWPPGKYKVRFRAARAVNSPEERRFLEFGLRVRNADLLSTHEVTGTLDNPQLIETTIEITRKHTSDNRQLYLREKGMHHYFHNPRKVFHHAKKRNGYGPEYVFWIDYLEVERVKPDSNNYPEGLNVLVELLGDQKNTPKRDILKEKLKQFARIAFRGTEPTDSYLERLIDQYHQKLKAVKNHRKALTHTLSVILSSPMFLYKSETSFANQQTIHQDELAQRLAYFLWSSPADEQLLELAKTGQLANPKILKEQTDRLLNDPRSEGMVKALAEQWLHMDRLDFFNVNIVKHRTFDNGVKMSARREIYETINYLLKYNKSIDDLLSSDYVVINNVLAQYYGLPAMKGDHFQKVELPKHSPRGGFLGMAAVHIMGGNGDESSPVERGAWVLRKLLNQAPPPAPANVPQLARLSDKLLTTRERLVAHQEEPQCASCHRKIDPIGFGLENFDAVGLWRTDNSYEVKKKDDKGKEKVVDKKSWKIIPAGQMYKGSEFKDYYELRDIVASHSDQFAKGFAKALTEYGMGRAVGFSDSKVIDDIVMQAKKEKYKIRSFVHALVQQPMFKTK